MVKKQRWDENNVGIVKIEHHDYFNDYILKDILFGDVVSESCDISVTDKSFCFMNDDYYVEVTRTIEGQTWLFWVTEEQIAPPPKAFDNEDGDSSDIRTLQIKARSQESGRSKLWTVELKNLQEATVYAFKDSKWSGPIFKPLRCEVVPDTLDDRDCDVVKPGCYKDAFAVALLEIIKLIDLF